MFQEGINYIRHLNSNKFFIGMMMLILNIGSKYIKIELTASQSKYLKTSLGRQILIFAITFIGTRDIFKALVLTGIFNILSGHLFHEESPYCIIPQKWRHFEEVLDKNKDNRISKEEVNTAIKVLEKARKQNQKKNYMRYW